MLSATLLRTTKQRQAIIEELKSVTSHPTAEEMYDMVRIRLPHISLGTVYRNLEKLSEEGVIRKLGVGGAKKRFDGNTTPHYHLRCQKCGRVDDLAMPVIQGIETEAALLSGYHISGHSLEVSGVCPDCHY
ncbi:MAG: transcriptional repressor [Deltaproteobacteria bacterium]|nr:transcriptional repressor [Deltaproteobacteria bacterium]